MVPGWVMAPQLARDEVIAPASVPGWVTAPQLASDCGPAPAPEPGRRMALPLVSGPARALGLEAGWGERRALGLGRGRRSVGSADRASAVVWPEALGSV
jgi:hypothetical protein